MTEFKAWRKQKGWTQGDLAEKIGEPRPTFQKWEAGISPFPPAVQARLRKLGYEGIWPHEIDVSPLFEDGKSAGSPVPIDVFHRELGKLEGKVENLERRLEQAFELIRDLKLRGS